MADLQRQLSRTSRTFALSIPLLAEPLRREVGVSYLLFRIADTFEDAACWPRANRLVALAEFSQQLRELDAARARSLAAQWVAAKPCDNEAYLELLGETGDWIAAVGEFNPTVREIVARHVLRTSDGMAGFVARSDEAGNLRLTDLADLKHYCYIVAGIVGELLTDLFLEAEPGLEKIRGELKERETAFGEGLQLVNILKDSADDARDGRTYLPPGVPRSDIFAVARADLRAATEYVLTLQRAGASRGIVEFTALPVLLATAALEELERSGPGSKVSRLKVAALMGKLRCDADAGIPVLTAPRP